MEREFEDSLESLDLSSGNGTVRAIVVRVSLVSKR